MEVVFPTLAAARVPQGFVGMMASGPVLRLRGRVLRAPPPGYNRPAYTVFRRAALASEGCRVKGPVATVCVKR